MILSASIWSFIANVAAWALLSATIRVQEPLSHDHPELYDFLPYHIRRNLGPYAPVYPVEPYRSAPSGCSLVQVNLLYRHGARGPTEDSSSSIRATLDKFKSLAQLSLDLEFVRDYEWRVGDSGLLPFGRKEAENAGRVDFERYGHLLNEHPPFVRISESPRVIDTATNWTASLAQASSGRVTPSSPLIISEKPSSNNTLENRNCPAFSPLPAIHAQSTFLATFAAPITARLNGKAPNANLSNTDMVNLFFMCGFDSVATESLSPFCDLFESEEFNDLGYYMDMGKYYLTGYGNPLGPVQGVGYVAELIARLTSTPVVPVTNVNRTLDTSPETFPLDRAFYVDFSHDNTMIPIFAALGTHRPSRDLPVDRRVIGKDESGGFVVSELVPFGGRLAVEKYHCDGEVEDKDDGSERGGSEWVRLVNNDRVVHVPRCARSWSDEAGLCELGAFLGTLHYARSGSEEDWAKCTT